jgi:hypothetical protein
MAETASPDNSGRTARWTLIAIAAVVAIGTIGALVTIVLRSPPTEGYRLRSQTMIPVTVNEADSTSCPESPSATPLDYSNESSLAGTLSLYEGEIVAVRVVVSPFNGPVPDTVSFSARWPASVVSTAGPTCVFVLADDTGTAPTLTWDATDEGEANFELESPRRFGDTTLEIWLEANEPPVGGTMFTELTTDQVGDEFVVDQLSGRVSIDRRPGALPDVAVVADTDNQTDTDLPFVATITNPDAQARSFDVRLSFEPTLPGVTIRPDTVPDGVACTEESPVTCSLGTLDDTTPVELRLVAEVDDRTALQSVQCGSAAPDVGVCIRATVTVDERGADPTATTDLFFPRGVSISGTLVIESEQGAIARRPGAEATALFTVHGPSDSDVASVTVVGSDCATIERVGSETDDGDAFLEPGERWWYDCTIESTSPDDFRLVVAGFDDTGSRITGTFTSVIQTIDPILTVDVGQPDADGRTTVVVTNSGRGPVQDIAVRLPGCDSRTAEPLVSLAEQQSFSMTCLAGTVRTDEVTVYGTDITGRAFVNQAG